MKLSKLFKNKKGTEGTLEAETAEYNEEVTQGTKIKIISAFLIVAVATLVASWVQEPTNTKVDLLQPIIEEEQPNSENLNTEEETTTVASTEENNSKVSISIKDYTFNPANITINTGTTVEWTNLDDVANTATGDDFNSGTLHTGEKYSYTFNKPGEYEYYSAFHPQMTGTITVNGDVVDSTNTEKTDSVTSDTETTPTPQQEETTTTPPTDQEKTSNTTEVKPSAVDTTDTTTITPNSVTLDAQKFIQEKDKEVTPKNLASSGPEDYLYILFFLTLLYLNRKKIIKT